MLIHLSHRLYVGHLTTWSVAMATMYSTIMTIGNRKHMGVRVVLDVKQFIDAVSKSLKQEL